MYLDSEPDTAGEEGTWVKVSHFIQVTPHHGGELSGDAARMLTTYLPYCFLSVYARRWNRAVAVSHFAQSLDGRIATDWGNSKWIGHEDNRTHAHRMRALCQGILIGSGTLKRDTPALTVRRVEGPDPRPIFLGSTVRVRTDPTRPRGSSPLTPCP